MTAQGEDILAYLERVIAAFEKAALSADQGTWTATREGYEEWDASVGTSTGGAVANSNIEDAGHIALHDPASVLRRCAADRKLIAEHRRLSLPPDVVYDECRLCGESNEAWPCPTLVILAEGYGRTEGER